MTLTNFWWLLIWMFTGGLLIAVLSIYRQSMAGIRHDKARSGLPVLSALLIVLPFIIWGGFRTDYFGDTGAYRRTFQAIPEGFGSLAPIWRPSPRTGAFISWGRCGRTLLEAMMWRISWRFPCSRWGSLHGCTGSIRRTIG